MFSTSAPTSPVPSAAEIVEGLRSKTLKPYWAFDPDGPPTVLTALEGALAYQLIFGKIFGTYVVEPALAARLVQGSEPTPSPPSSGWLIEPADFENRSPSEIASQVLDMGSGLLNGAPKGMKWVAIVGVRLVPEEG